MQVLTMSIVDTTQVSLLNRECTVEHQYAGLYKLEPEIKITGG